MSNIVKMQVYKLFERFWHWLQTVLIFILLFSGFRIHGTHELISFSDATTLHTWAAILIMMLWAFATFWLFTTGEWRHYVPTRENLISVARFYILGIFKGEHHPYIKTYRRKHNPLQAIAYMMLKIVIFPAIWMSGTIYLLISFGLGDFLSGVGTVWIARIHTLAAVSIVGFFIVHIYMLTMGHSFIGHIKPMITGFDDVDLTDEQLAYLQADELDIIKENSQPLQDATH